MVPSFLRFEEEKFAGNRATFETPLEPPFLWHRRLIIDIDLFYWLHIICYD